MNAIKQPYRGEDMTGKVFDNLHVLKMDGKSKHGHVLWLCKCSCGETVHKEACHLRDKTAFQACRKCAVHHHRAAQAARIKHGHAHSTTGKHSPTYISWSSMRQRCLNPNSGAYESYGGAGVTIAPQWDDFSVFLRDMGERPEGTSIDRYPVCNGNYEPSNCRWATMSEQERNKRPYDRGNTKQRAAQRRMTELKVAA